MNAGAQLHRWVRQWWSGEAGWSGTVANVLLAPAEWSYRAITAARNQAYEAGLLEQAAPPIPVVSVGNIAVGGSGKTPFAAWLAGELRRRGRRPAIVVRGYGEDEVHLHRELNPEVPVFVDARRVAAVHRAAASGCDSAILDDGFQHRRLGRSLDVVLVAAERWTRDPHLLPRGPWRERPSSLVRADVLVVVQKTGGGAADRVATDLAGLFPGTPTVRCTIEPCELTALHPDQGVPQSLLNQSVLAVASLADPAPFAENLRQMGAQVELAEFPDHFQFARRDADALARRAAGRPLLMTGKDAVKLRVLLSDQLPAYVLRQRVVIAAGADVLEAAISRALNPE